MASEQPATIKTTFTIEEGIGGRRKVNNDAVPFEDALELTGIGRYNYLLFFIGTLILLSMVLVVFGCSYVITTSNCDLHLTTETKGLIASMPMLGIVASSHLWGWVADTRGRRYVLFISLIGSFLFATLSSLATSWQMLAATNFLCSFFASASNSVVYAFFGESTPASARNKLIMYFSGSLIAAQAFIALNAFIVLSFDFTWHITESFTYRPWRLLELVYGLWTGISALLLMLVEESPKFLASKGLEEESLKVMSRIYAMNTGKRPEDYPVKSLLFEESHGTSKGGGILKSMWDQTTPLFRKPFLFKTLVLSYIIIDVYAISPALLMWTPIIANSYAHAVAEGNIHITFCELFHQARGHANTTHIEPICVDKVENIPYITLTAFSLFLFVLNNLNSYLLKYMKKKTIIIAYHVFSGVCGVVLPFVNNLHGGVIVYFMFQIYLVCMSLTTAFTVEVYPTYLRGMAVCLTMMIGRGSSFILINLVGVMLENFCNISFYTLGAYVLSGAVMALWLPGEQKPKGGSSVKPTKR